MTPVPIHLITGLLGSGKTTLLRHLLAQKPAEERWGLIINDFGPVEIDAALLQEADEIVEVRGGCVCCSAQHGLRRALDTLLRHPLHRILVEPTGVSHPAEMTDLFLHHPRLALQAIVTVMTPMQLTPDRWRRSALMRDLVTLADSVVLNKTDLACADDIRQAEALLRTASRPPLRVLHTRFARLPLEALLRPHAPPPLLAWQSEPHRCATFHPHQPHTPLPGLLDAQWSESDGLIAAGYRFDPHVLFARPALRQLFAAAPPVRAKGLLRLGKRWQRLQWSDGRLELEETAWQRDSRLLAFFACRDDIKHFEKGLSQACVKKLA